ncbi:YqaA family protein [Chondromyces apiculatus]|uniref:YqaA family protein n=1 Tax=Chondromyces apiculatus TaxID=51 RepID=UPI001E587AC1|nr:VTT domain-containing protein [Chondromyces apiculatus]
MSTPAPTPSPPGEAPRPTNRRELLRASVQLVVGLAALAGAAALAGFLLRDELDGLGRAFVGRFGVVGMFVGTYVADAFTFPIPPVFYLFTALTSDVSQVLAVAAVCVASMAAGETGYLLASKLAQFEFFARRLDAARPRVDALFARYGTWAMVAGSLSPLPYSLLCYFSGIYRVPQRIFVVLILLRIPRLVVTYALIRLGWATGA